MFREIHFLYKNTEFLEKIVISLIILIPLALCTSILIADLFASLIGLITIYWIFFKKKNLDSFKLIKKPLAVIFLFYFEYKTSDIYLLVFVRFPISRKQHL